MSWQTVFFSSNGRMGQKDFWIAALVLFLAWIVSHVLHVLAFFAWLVLAYCWICILSKRLHDAGRNGWLVIVPVAIGCTATMVAVVIGGIAAISAIATGGFSDYDPSSWAVFWGSLGFAAILFGVASLANLIFLLWTGLASGDLGDNRYGSPPVPWLKPATPPPAAA